MAQGEQGANVSVGAAETGVGMDRAKRQVEGLARVWSWLTTSRYTRALEAEVTRLRVDNGALMRALLGAGHVVQVPPRTQGGSPKSNEAASASTNAVKPVPPARRRSWQQIGRMLELEVSRMLAQKHGGVGVRPAQDAFSESHRGPSDASGIEKSESSSSTGKSN